MLRAKSRQWQARLLLYPAGHVRGTEAGPGASIKNRARGPSSIDPSWEVVWLVGLYRAS